MENDYWSLERWRFALVLFAGLLGGLLSGYWLVSFMIVFLVYIAWFLFKLQQLHNWLKNGSRVSDIPDSNGIWERINYHILTTQKKSAKRKKRMANLLKRFQGIITSLPYASVVLNGNNEIDWANKTAAQLLRINLKTDRGQRVENLIRLPKVYKLLAKNKQKEIEVSSLFDDNTKLAIQLIPIQNDLKMLIARDISERVHLQQMRKNFIANASHELRTPLTVIAGYLEIMQGEENFPEHLQPALQASAEQSARMQCIIEDLLTLSRLENSELSEDNDEILDMSSMIKGICHDESTIDKNAHMIDTRHINPEIRLRGAEAEIVSVCSNLIHNAIRYTSKGTKIRVCWQQLDNGDGLLQVIDEGDGIAPEHLSHLTERFYRVDKGRSQATGGTGLGLAIVQHIVQRHGGRLTIHSELGKGSVFEVFFPGDRIISGPSRALQHA